MIGWALTWRKRTEVKQEQQAKRDAANNDLVASDANELRELYRKQTIEIGDLRAKVEVLTGNSAAMKARYEVVESEKKALREMITLLSSELEHEREARKRALEDAHKAQQLLDVRNDEINELVESVRARDVRIAGLEAELKVMKGKHTRLMQYVVQHMPQHKTILDSLLHETGEFTVTS